MNSAPGAPAARTAAKTCLNSTTALAPILISDGDKGGAGKSFLARILAYLLTHAGFPWEGFDLDPRNGHLSRFHKDMPVERVDWTVPAEWNRLYDRISEVEDSHALLIDLPAQVGTLAAREFPRLLATAKHFKRPVFRFWTLGRDFDSVNLLAQTLDLVELQNTFAVLNLRSASREDFELWNGSNTQTRLLKGKGAELQLPALSPGVAAEIEANDLSFHQALSSLKQPYFRFDIEAYLETIQREFATVLERIA
jgi:hypothetical protein